MKTEPAAQPRPHDPESQRKTTLEIKAALLKAALLKSMAMNKDPIRGAPQGPPPAKTSL